MMQDKSRSEWWNTQKTDRTHQLSPLRIALPKPPTSLVVTDVTATSLKLTWSSGNIDPIESYIVQYKPKYNQDTTFEENSVEDNEYTATGLGAYTLYEFRVVAINNIGRGMPSSSVDIQTGQLGKIFGAILFTLFLCTLPLFMLVVAPLFCRFHFFCWFVFFFLVCDFIVVVGLSLVCVLFHHDNAWYVMARLVWDH